MKKSIDGGTLEMKDGFISFTGVCPGVFACFECTNIKTFNMVRCWNDFMYAMDCFNELQDALSNARSYEKLFHQSQAIR